MFIMNLIHNVDARASSYRGGGSRTTTTYRSSGSYGGYGGYGYHSYGYGYGYGYGGYYTRTHVNISPTVALVLLGIGGTIFLCVACFLICCFCCMNKKGGVADGVPEGYNAD